MMDIMCSNNISNWFIVAFSALAIVVSIIIFSCQISKDNKHKANACFDQLYNDTFALRKEISDIIKQDWYYEISMSVLQNEESNEKILLYLNRTNNLFAAVIKSRIFKRSLYDLIPIKLFNRLMALIPYIEYYRKIDNNSEKFSDYIKFIQFCKKRKFIKKTYYKTEKYIWVGIRKSDIKYNSNKKSIIKSISIFYDGMSNSEFKFRPNQNLMDTSNYFIKSIDQMAKKHKKLNLVLYNPQWAYIFNINNRLKIASTNDNSLLDFFNDKLICRSYFQRCGIQCIPCTVMDGQELSINKLQEHFKVSSWIVQEINGSGGYGTWLINIGDDNNTLKILNKQKKRYLVSAYYKNSISVNVTIIISEKQTTVFPASIQIIEQHKNRLVYRGNDFIAFRDFPTEIKERILNISSNIANSMRKKGYLGIAGIDLIVADNNIYFCEVNPRFQGSTPILSRYLTDREILTKAIHNKNKFYSNYESYDLIQLNKNAFNGMINTSVNFYDEINYSCYFYFNDDFNSKEIQYKLKLLGDRVDKDGFDEKILNTNDSYINEDSYLFKAIFDKKICQISPDNEIWVSDNIKINKLHFTKEELKIALLNQGVRIDSINCADFKEATFDAVDFYIEKDGLYINSPKNNPWVDFSPFLITKQGSEYILQINGENYSVIEVEFNKVQFSDDHPERKSLYVSSDRLRINPILGCEYKSIGKGCKFCDFSPKSKTFSEDELTKAYDYSKDIDYSHIMIGGGTVIDWKNQTTILNLVKYIRKSNPTIDITLMSVPPLKDDLIKYKCSGITDVSFNIEILDSNLAKQLMPAKSSFDRDYYFDIFKESVKIWTGYGNVRTLIMVGFDKYDTILEGIKKLKNIGVQPVLSVFRPLTGSCLSNVLPPSNEYLLKLYNDCKRNLEPYELGPKCNCCKNNTLSL